MWINSSAVLLVRVEKQKRYFPSLSKARKNFFRWFFASCDSWGISPSIVKQTVWMTLLCCVMTQSSSWKINRFLNPNTVLAHICIVKWYQILFIFGIILQQNGSEMKFSLHWNFATVRSIHNWSLRDVWIGIESKAIRNYECKLSKCGVFFSFSFSGN